MRIVGFGEIFGFEDYILKRPRKDFVKCHSITGELLVMKNEDFVSRLKLVDRSWTAVLKHIQEMERSREQKIKNEIALTTRIKLFGNVKRTLKRNLSSSLSQSLKNVNSRITQLVSDFEKMDAKITRKRHLRKGSHLTKLHNSKGNEKFDISQLREFKNPIRASHSVERYKTHTAAIRTQRESTSLERINRAKSYFNIIKKLKMPGYAAQAFTLCMSESKATNYMS